MVISRRNIICALSCLLWVNVLVAQERQFRLLALGEIAHFFYDVEGGTEDIDAVPSSFSRFYPAPKNGRVVLYRKLPAEEPGGVPLKIAVAEARLPEGDGPFLIVLKKKQSLEDELFDSAIIDHSLRAHPKDTFRVFNFSNRPLAVRLSDKNLLLESSASEVVPYAEGRKTWLKVAIKEGKWTPVRSAPVVMGSDSRTTILLTDLPSFTGDPAPKGVAVKQVREQVIEDEAGNFHIR